MSMLGLDDTFSSEVIKKAEKRAARPVDPKQEEIQSGSGIFYEMKGRLANAAAPPAPGAPTSAAPAPVVEAPLPAVEATAEELQGYELIKEAEGSLIMGTLDAPVERARGFSALAALKRSVALEPTTCVFEAQAAAERLSGTGLPQARALVELARPGASAVEIDRLGLGEAKLLIAEQFDCETASLRSEIALLEAQAGDDPAPTFAAAKRILVYPSLGAYVAALAEIGSAEVRSGLAGDETFARARALLDRGDMPPAEQLAARTQLVRHRTECGQIDKAGEELTLLSSSGDPSAPALAIRARGYLAVAYARAGRVPSTQMQILSISREPNPATAPEAIEALCNATRALAEAGYSRAAISMRDSALLLLKQLQSQGIKKLPGTCIEALAVAMASCGGVEEAQRFASYTGAGRPHAETEVALAIARAGVGLVRDAQKRRSGGPGA